MASVDFARRGPSTATPAPGYDRREVTQPPNWHSLVVYDLFLNAVTTGLFLACATCELADPTRFAPVTTPLYVVALAVLVADLLCLVMDLGDPLKFHHMLRVFKPSSPMSLGTWCLTAYSGPLTVVAVLVVAGWVGLIPDAWQAAAGWVRWGALVAGLGPVFGSMGYKGVLFSTSAQPGWRDARWLGAYHTASAIAIGGAVVFATASMTGQTDAAAKLRPALIGLLLVQAVPLLLLARELRPTFDAVYTPAWFAVAGGALVAGILVPLAVMSWGGWLALIGVAGLIGVSFGVRSVIVRLPHHVAAVTRPTGHGNE